MHVNLHFDPDEVALHPLTHTHNPSTKQKHTHTHTHSQISSEVGNTQSVSDTGELKEEIFALPDLLMKPGRDGEEIWSEEKKKRRKVRKKRGGVGTDETNKRRRAAIEETVEDQEEC